MKISIAPRLHRLERMESVLLRKEFLEEIGEEAKLDVQDNIDTEGRNLDDPWEQSLRAEKQNGVTLRASNLMYNSIHYEIEGDSVVILGNRKDDQGQDLITKHVEGDGVPERNFMRLSEDCERSIQQIVDEALA